MLKRMWGNGLVAGLKLFDGLGCNPAVWLAGVVAVSACSAEAPRAETGQLTMGLVAEVDGVSYRLRNAQFDVAGPANLTIDTEDAPDATSVQRVLGSGNYGLTLRDGWHLERRVSLDMPFETVDATLASPNPTAFSIAEDETTNVAYVFDADGTTVPLDRGNLNLTIQVTADSPTTTPVSTDREAATAVYSALATQADAHWGFRMATTAEATALEVLNLVDSSWAAELVLDPTGEPPAPQTMPCPEGGKFVATWSRSTLTSQNEPAAVLRIDFDRCLGRQAPEEWIWLTQDEGAIQVRLIPSPDGTFRVISVTYGDGKGTAAYERSGRNRYSLDPEFRNVYSFEVNGTFVQSATLEGAFSYTIEGRSSEEFFYLFVDEGGETLSGSTRSTMTASKLVLSGSRTASVSGLATWLRFRSGALLEESADPWSSSSISFSYADFVLDVLERHNEGNKSVSMSGVVSIDSARSDAPPCAQGTYRFTTLEPLLDENHSLGGPPEIVHGKLRLNDDVYATFTRAQELRVTRGDHAPVLYHAGPYARSALSAALSCPDYF